MSALASPSLDGSFSSSNREGSFSANLPPVNGSPQPPLKKKRNMPGNPDPESEVIALSPRTLLAINRFVCEICNKGFQRDQNLQLHRRGHNLPWKLRQRSNKEVKKKVYICPEISCVHHDPSRALGDLTGIKKHFCRKHGEKKWKCEKCSKKYAVQSDWKAHIKTCGTREYRCDCGTLFSRRDSFITHRAFCDALAEESAKASEGVTTEKSSAVTQSIMPTVNSTPQLQPPQTLHNAAQSHMEISDGSSCSPSITNYSGFSLWLGPGNPMKMEANYHTPQEMSNNSTKSPSQPQYETSFASLLLPSSSSTLSNNNKSNNNLFSSFLAQQSVSSMNSIVISEPSTSPLSLSTSAIRSSDDKNNQIDSFPGLPFLYGKMSSTSAQGAQMSATALLQKAAQMGASVSDSSMLKSYANNNQSSSSSAIMENNYPNMQNSFQNDERMMASSYYQAQQMNIHQSGFYNSLLVKDIENMHPGEASYRFGLRHGMHGDQEVADRSTRDFLGVGRNMNINLLPMNMNVDNQKAIPNIASICSNSHGHGGGESLNMISIGASDATSPVQAGWEAS